MHETRPCPYCSEDIRTEAKICRYCRSRLTTLDPERWHRDHPERRLAGVAIAVARALVVPVAAVRLGFIVLTFIHGLGPLLYAALWLLVPFAPGGPSPFERAVAAGRGLMAGLAATPPRERPRAHDDRADRSGGLDRPEARAS